MTKVFDFCVPDTPILMRDWHSNWLSANLDTIPLPS